MAHLIHQPIHRPGFPFQLKNFYTGEPAPESIRIRVQANIDRMRIEMASAPTESQRCSLAVSIMRLEGKLCQVRS